jgi:hypothetical protein
VHRNDNGTTTPASFLTRRRRRLLLGLAAVWCASGAPSAWAADHVTKIVKRAGTPVAVQPSQDADAFAKCRSGEKLVGGGAIGEGGAVGDVLRISAPDPNHARRWFARASNEDAAPHDLTAFAFCARSGGKDHVTKIVERTGNPVSAQPGQVADAFARCRSGERLVGGGAFGGGRPAGDRLKASGPDPSNARRWFASAVDSDVVNPNNLTASAFCARSGGSDHVRRIAKRGGNPVSVQTVQAVDAFAKCRASEALVGGGALAAGPGNVLKVSAPDPSHDRRWLARARNGDIAPHNLTAFAFCAR